MKTLVPISVLASICVTPLLGHAESGTRSGATTASAVGLAGGPRNRWLAVEVAKKMLNAEQNSDETLRNAIQVMMEKLTAAMASMDMAEVVSHCRTDIIMMWPNPVQQRGVEVSRGHDQIVKYLQRSVGSHPQVTIVKSTVVLDPEPIPREGDVIYFSGKATTEVGIRGGIAAHDLDYRFNGSAVLTAGKWKLACLNISPPDLSGVSVSVGAPPVIGGVLVLLMTFSLGVLVGRRKTHKAVAAKTEQVTT